MGSANALKDRQCGCQVERALEICAYSATLDCLAINFSTMARYSLSGLGNERKRLAISAPLNLGGLAAEI